MDPEPGIAMPPLSVRGLERVTRVEQCLRGTLKQTMVCLAHMSTSMKPYLQDFSANLRVKVVFIQAHPLGAVLGELLRSLLHVRTRREPLLIPLMLPAQDDHNTPPHVPYCDAACTGCLQRHATVL